MLGRAKTTTFITGRDPLTAITTTTLAKDSLTTTHYYILQTHFSIIQHFL